MYFSSPWLAHYEDIPPAISYPDYSMYEQLKLAAQAAPNACAHSFFGRKTTYKKFLARIDLAARGLMALGITKGDRVTICMPNMPQALECFYALNRLGAAANMAHPLCAPEELRFYLQASQSKLVLTLDQHFDKTFEATQRLTFPCQVLTAKSCQALPKAKKLLYSCKKQACKLPLSGHIPWELVLKLGRGRPLPPDTGLGQDAAAILYSGGTTGKAKGVVLSNSNFNALALQTAAICGFTELSGKKMLALLPIFHGFGLGIGIHAPLSVGASCILLPRFHERDFLRVLKKEKPNMIPGVPALFEAFLELPGLKHTDLSFLMGLFCGGDALQPDLKKRFDRFLKDHNCSEQLRQGYGLTECTSATCLMPRHKCREGSAGIPFPDTLYGIFAPDTHAPVKPGDEGEICISGPTVMLGYLDSPEETAKALQIHPDGRLWLHTGDLGHMDEEGFVYFHQRLGRMILCNGYNIYPCQLEETLTAFDGVQDACVIGVPEPKKGHIPKAFVVLKKGILPDENTRQAILAHCSKHIAAYAIPKEIIFLPALPKTALGKTDYRALEDKL